MTLGVLLHSFLQCLLLVTVQETSAATPFHVTFTMAAAFAVPRSGKVILPLSEVLAAVRCGEKATLMFY